MELRSIFKTSYSLLVDVKELPELYVGDYILSHFKYTHIKKLFSRVYPKPKHVLIKIAIMAALSNEGRVDTIIDLLNNNVYVDASVQNVLYKYASLSTYFKLKDRLTISLYKCDISKTDLCRYTITEYQMILIDNIDPTALPAAEYLDLCIRFGQYNNLDRILFFLLERSEQYRARVFAAELKRRGIPYNTAIDLNV